MRGKCTTITWSCHLIPPWRNTFRSWMSKSATSCSGTYSWRAEGEKRFCRAGRKCPRTGINDQREGIRRFRRIGVRKLLNFPMIRLIQIKKGTARQVAQVEDHIYGYCATMTPFILWRSQPYRAGKCCRKLSARILAKTVSTTTPLHGRIGLACPSPD